MSALARLAAALLPPEHGGPPPDELARRVSDYLECTTPPTRWALRAGAGAVSGLARLSTGRALDSLPPADRVAVLERFGRLAGLDALDGLKAAMLLVHGAATYEDESRAAANAHPPARPDPPLHVTASRDWPSVSRAGAIVVGSGAGGAMVARTLARAGVDVVVVEEGRRHGVDELRAAAPLQRFADLYRGGGPTVALGAPPVILPIGRAVGGTTVVNSGTCYRTPDHVLRSWRDDFGVEVADPGRFEPYLAEVESTLAVDAVPLSIMGANGRTMLDGAARLGWKAGPLRRNAPGCGGCCQCAVGCPRNAKAGVHLNALPDACAHGARIVSELRVSRLVHDRGRVTGVLGRRPDGTAVRIDAPLVVVAAGATETPTLLRRSGVGSHPQLGRNLALHPSLAAAGRFDHDITAWRGVLQSAAVEELHDEHRILIEATSTPPGMGSMALPGLGAALLDELADAHRNVTLGAMIGDGGWGAVHGRTGATTTITYGLRGDGPARLRLSLRAMSEVLFAAGAHEVILGTAGAPTFTSLGAVDEHLSAMPTRRMHLAAFHPTGTARAGASAEQCPVDARGRLRGIDGAWVADASIVPSCPDVNPQISIMALALAVADEIVRATD